MRSITESFRSGSEMSRSVGDFRGIDFRIYSSPFMTDPISEDAHMIAGFFPVSARADVLDYQSAEKLVPDLFREYQLLEKFSGYNGQKGIPKRIDSVPLQMGTYAFHFLHRMVWENGSDFWTVSYIPRGGIDTLFGQHAATDIKYLPLLSSRFRSLPPRVRRHTDIITPLFSTILPSPKGVLAVYFTPFDDKRGEISVIPTTYRRTTSGKIETLPVPRISLFYTKKMERAVEHQVALSYLLENQDAQDDMRAIITMQLERLAISHAVIAMVCGELPQSMSMDSGDWMGHIEPGVIGKNYVKVPRLRSLRLMTVRGGVVGAETKDKFLHVLRGYTYHLEGVDHNLFESLDDERLLFAWQQAKELLSKYGVVPGRAG